MELVGLEENTPKTETKKKKEKAKTHAVSAVRLLNSVNISGINAYKKLRTQKAKGLLAIRSNPFLHPNPIVWVADPTREEAYKKESWHEIGHHFTKPFARPCPMVPCHGFVDSRIVSNLNEWRAVLNETKEADPKGEVLITEWINATASAVVDSRQITTGHGHDGVTSGKGVHAQAKLFQNKRWAPEIESLMSMTLRRYINIPPNHSVLIELVRNGKGMWIPVQVRGVAAKEAYDSHCISKYKQVTNAVLVNMLDWSNNKSVLWIAENKNRNRKAVVCMVNSILSHVGCLLREDGFTVVDDKFMQERAARSSDADRTYTFISRAKYPSPSRRKEIADWMMYGLQCTEFGDIDLHSTLATLASGAAQEYSSTTTHPALIGIGSAMLFRLSAIASVGEFRYWWHERKSHIPTQRRVSPFGKTPIAGRTSESLRDYLFAVSRSQLYDSGFTIPLFKLLSLLSCADGTFNQTWSNAAMGGMRWHNITSMTMRFYTSMRKFILNPTIKNYKEQGVLGNALSMTVHNGGSGPLSKFGSGNYFQPSQFVEMLHNLPAKPETWLGLPVIRDTYKAWTDSQQDVEFAVEKRLLGTVHYGYWRSQGSVAMTYSPEFLPNHSINLHGSFQLYSDRHRVVQLTRSNYCQGTMIHYDNTHCVHLMDSRGETLVLISPKYRDIVPSVSITDLLDTGHHTTKMREDYECVVHAFSKMLYAVTHKIELDERGEENE